MKSRFVVLVAIISLLVFFTTSIGTVASSVTPGQTNPESWKVFPQKIMENHLTHASKVDPSASKFGPVLRKSLPEESVQAPLPDDGVAKGSFRVEEDGKVTVIIALKEAPVAAVKDKTLISKNLLKVRKEQIMAEDVLASIGGVEVTDTLEYAYNGLVARFPKEKLAEVQRAFGKESVFPTKTYYLDLAYSTVLTGAATVWTNPGYDGTDVVVGVVDTGVDYNHPDLGGTGLPTGTFPTVKVIAGWDFGDDDPDPMDLNGHGTHVAGTMAAKAATDGGVTGMAPEAKLIVAKIVKGGAGSASSADIAAAFDWMLQKKLEGVNLASINMSFGFPGGWNNPTDPEQVAIQYCVDNGIFVSLSAGNEYWSVYPSNQFYNYGENPSKFTYYPADIGIVGTPAVTPGPASTAASWNSVQRVKGYKVGATSNYYGYIAASGAPDPLSVFGPNQDLPYVYCGLGGIPTDNTSPDPNKYIPYGIDDFASVDVKGKIALIKRGTFTFGTKALNAMKQGARGVIIYNDGADPTRYDLISITVEGYGISIPVVFSNYLQGEDLRTNQATYQTVRFDGHLTDVAVHAADRMVDFSSWGTDPNLNFKPELCAPGGGIWSTVPIALGSYANYSGTSMAAPHVSGAAALIKQAHPGWTPAQVKTALMNTATLLTDPTSGLPYSPRLQGAGRINVYNALLAPVFVTDNTTNYPAEPLGDTDGATSKSFTVKLTNTSTATSYTFDLSATIQCYDNFRVHYNLSGGSVAFPGGTSVTVPAGGTALVDVTVSVADNAQFENIFVDGFVTLTPTPSGPPELHVPYTLFWGDWQDTRYTFDWIHNPVIDPPPDDPAEWTWWGYTWLYTLIGSDIYYLGLPFGATSLDQLDRNLIAISPNGDGIWDNLYPLISLMRGTPDLTFTVHKADGTYVDTVAQETYVHKNFVDYPYWDSWDNWWLWAPDPGTIPDGSYFLRFKTEVPGTLTQHSGQFQAIDLPFIVDTVSPEITVSYDIKKKPAVSGKYSFTISWTGSDDRSGLWGFDLYLDGQYVDTVSPTTTTYTFSGLPDAPHYFMVVAWDNASNYAFSICYYNTLIMGPGWNFFSFPAQTNPDPSKVLPSTPAPSALWWFNEATQKLVNKNITFALGDAYWLRLTKRTSIAFSGVLNMQPSFSIPLVKGRNDIGVPYPANIPWADVKVKKGTQTVSIDQAIKNKWIRSVSYWYVFFYKNSRYKDFMPGYGYIIYANAPLTLIFRNPLY